MKKLKKRKFNFILVLFTFLFLAGVISCGKDRSGADTAMSSGTPVQVTHPRIQDVTEYVDMNANTIFLKKEVLRATFQGFIDKIYKNIGDHVRVGDLVFAIKTRESAADDSIHIDLGGDTFKGSIPVRAHSDGVMTTLNYHAGDFVADGEEIAIISNPSSLRITLNVPYAYVSRIGRRSDCHIFLPDGRTVPAAIQEILPSVDPVSQTQTFLLNLKHQVSLPENLNVNARLPLKTAKDAVLLPRSAVLSNETQDRFWVMKMANDSTAVRVDVQKGIENDSLIQITKPVFHPGEQIISDGAFGLPDTAKVTISR